MRLSLLKEDHSLCVLEKTIITLIASLHQGVKKVPNPQMGLTLQPIIKGGTRCNVNKIRAKFHTAA